MNVKRRLIVRVPGKGAFFRGRCTAIETIWHKDEPPEGIVNILRWMESVELGARWVWVLVGSKQKARQN